MSKRRHATSRSVIGTRFVAGLAALLAVTPAIARSDEAVARRAPAGTSVERARKSVGTKAPELSFEQRVQAQARLEQLAARDRARAAGVPAGPPLGAAPLRDKVRATLDKSAALEHYWKRAITPAQLQAEIDRMVRGTRDARRLRAMFAALGDDPVLIAECVARPALADRLLRNAYAADPALHAGVRERALAALSAGADLRRAATSHGVTSYRESSWVLDRDGACAASAAPGTRCLDEASFAAQMAALRARLQGDPDSSARTALQETPDAFYVEELLAAEPGRARVASARWAKRPFDAWWSDARRVLASRRSPVAPTAPESSASVYRVPPFEAETCTPDTWDVSVAPEARDRHTALWTGSEMLVWGGSAGEYRNDGQRYDPATDTWTPMSAGPNVPAVREQHTAVWTGREMIVWGGAGPGGAMRSGARYNPATDVWITLDPAGAPAARYGHTAVWTGSAMLVWGGFSSLGALDTGALYDPLTDAWTPTSVAPAIASARGQHTALWLPTGVMIVWGGVSGPQNGAPSVGSGARYDVATDSWSPVAATGAPSPRDGHTAVFTGTEMIVWGGRDVHVYLRDGARYDLATDTWAPLPAPGAPASRFRHTAVWTGDEMIVWGGYGPPWLASGARYNPATDAWTPVAAAGAPLPRYRHTAVWTGDEMIVFGGEGAGGWLATGGRYRPDDDTWLPTSLGANAPSPREEHSAVITGAGEMIVWGGVDRSGWLNSGGVYQPATDTWTPTSVGPLTPSPRKDHAAAWTGSEMVVWGGFGDLGLLATGARYDLATDTWSPVTAVGAPSARYRHSGVAAGAGRMIVWGGQGGNGPLGDGASYDAGANAWAPIAGAGAPSPRAGHRALFTHRGEMVVWGGSTGSLLLGSGARYVAAADAWIPMAALDAPSPRQFHTMVEDDTGRLIVWGGFGPAGALATGARYNPGTDTWVPTGTGVDLPTPRYHHTAVWTDIGEMVVWGGYGPEAQTNTGGRYRPLDDSWTPTGLGSGIPGARYYHTAVLTPGARMIVWGGIPYGSTTSLYCSEPCTASVWYEDRDGDGFGSDGSAINSCVQPNGYVAAGGDCRDLDALSYPGAPEVAGDSVDGDCDGAEVCFADGDGDHVGTPAMVASADTDCFDAGEAGAADDCDDADATIYPGAPEVLADGLDQDCDLADSCFADADADGFGAGAVRGDDLDCADPGECANGLDCDDGRPSVRPGGVETADCLDEDCNGLVDDGLAAALAGVTPAQTAKDRLASALVLDGAEFACGARVAWTDVDGVTVASLAPTWVSAGRLSLDVPAALLDTLGTAQLRVENPAGSPSGSQPFRILPGVELPSGAATRAGADVVVPLRVNPADGVTNLALSFTYDPAVLTPTGVYETAFTDGFDATFDLSVPGVVGAAQAAGSGSAPLAGTGDAAWVVFRVNAGAQPGSPLAWTTAALHADAGPIEAIPVDGAFTRQARASLLSLPDDAKGAARRPEDPQSAANVVRVPLRIEPSTGITALSAFVRYNPLVLQALSVHTTSYSGGWTVAYDASVPGAVSIDLAGPEIGGTGTLAEIEFRVVGADGAVTPLDLAVASVNGGPSTVDEDDGLFTACLDGDDDGVPACGGDCDDTRAEVGPRLAEVACDGLDNDCRAQTEDGRDSDHDGFDVCGPADPADPDGYPVDCDDARVSDYPGAPELCDGRDNDCSGVTDENPEAGARSCADASSTQCRLDLCTSVDGQPACEYADAGTCGVSGVVRYFLTEDVDGDPATVDPAELSAKPVAGVRLDLAGTTVLPDATTAADGTYVTGSAFGDVSLAALPRVGSPRADDTGSISSADAAAIAKHAVGIRPLLNLQGLAGDVTGSGGLSAFDASLVAQYAVRLIDHFPVADARGSDWAFVRCDGGDAANCPAWTTYDPGVPPYRWTPLARPEVADLYGVLYGDVTGNWPNVREALASAPAKADASAKGNALAEAAPAKLVPLTTPRENPARLYLAAAPAPLGDGRFRAVVGLLDADGVQALDLVLDYDPAATEIVSTAQAGFAKDYALVKSDTGGRVALALYGTRPLQGGGELLEITFRPKGPVVGVPFRLDGRANEGLVPLNW